MRAHFENEKDILFIKRKVLRTWINLSLDCWLGVILDWSSPWIAELSQFWHSVKTTYSNSFIILPEIFTYSLSNTVSNSKSCTKPLLKPFFFLATPSDKCNDINMGNIFRISHSFIVNFNANIQSKKKKKEMLLVPSVLVCSLFFLTEDLIQRMTTITKTGINIIPANMGGQTW